MFSFLVSLDGLLELLLLAGRGTLCLLLVILFTRPHEDRRLCWCTVVLLQPLCCLGHLHQ